MKFIRTLIAAACFVLPVAAHAQTGAGTTPLSLVQQFNANGQPLAGCQLYFYVAGTVATPQNVYADYGLSQPLPNPLTCDQSGRVPQHWLAAGLVHIRLTDANGLVQVDTTMQVLGPSAGGGGSGATVDPTTIASTGDIKFRSTAEVLTGWVQLNGQTIGSAVSGAAQRANADTQNLFVYLWTNCPHCAVVGGKGASAAADFAANKQITLPDWRDAGPAGRDCMGSTCLGGLLASNISSGGSDGVDTPGAWGGVANNALSSTNQLPQFTPVFAGTQQTWGLSINGFAPTFGVSKGDGTAGDAGSPSSGSVTLTPAGTIAAIGSASPSTFSDMDPFKLVTWYIKL